MLLLTPSTFVGERDAGLLVNDTDRSEGKTFAGRWAIRT